MEQVFFFGLWYERRRSAARSAAAAIPEGRRGGGIVVRTHKWTRNHVYPCYVYTPLLILVGMFFRYGWEERSGMVAFDN